MSKFQPFLCAVLLLVLSQAAEAESVTATRPHSEAFWRERIARVHRGMKRSTVEKLLPLHSSPVETEAVPGGRYSLYALDSEWMVKVPYNFHGFIEDPKKNPRQLMHLYDNQVIGPIKLIHQHTEIDWTLFPPTR